MDLENVKRSAGRTAQLILGLADPSWRSGQHSAELRDQAAAVAMSLAHDAIALTEEARQHATLRDQLALRAGSPPAWFEPTGVGSAPTTNPQTRESALEVQRWTRARERESRAQWPWYFADLVLSARAPLAPTPTKRETRDADAVEDDGAKVRTAAGDEVQVPGTVRRADGSAVPLRLVPVDANKLANWETARAAGIPLPEVRPIPPDRVGPTGPGNDPLVQCRSCKETAPHSKMQVMGVGTCRNCQSLNVSRVDEPEARAAGG